MSRIVRGILFFYCLAMAIASGNTIHNNPKDDDIPCQNRAWACLCTMCVFHVFTIVAQVAEQHDQDEPQAWIMMLGISFFLHIWPLVLFHTSDCVANLPTGMWKMITCEMVNFYIFGAILLIYICCVCCERMRPKPIVYVAPQRTTHVVVQRAPPSPQPQPPVYGAIVFFHE